MRTNRISAGFGVSVGASTLGTVDPSELPPIAVTFPAATLGTVGPAAAKTSGGVAQALFTSGAAAGQASVMAMADSQSATTANFSVVGPGYGPQGPAGPAAPAAKAHPLVVRSSRLRASRKHVVRVSVACPKAAGACEGLIAISVGRTALGQARFLVRGGPGRRSA